jgi:hypothetical protein
MPNHGSRRGALPPLKRWEDGQPHEKEILCHLEICAKPLRSSEEYRMLVWSVWIFAASVRLEGFPCCLQEFQSKLRAKLYNLDTLGTR